MDLKTGTFGTGKNTLKKNFSGLSKNDLKTGTFGTGKFFKICVPPYMKLIKKTMYSST